MLRQFSSVFAFSLAAVIFLCSAPHYASCLNTTFKINEIGYPLETYSYWTADKYLLGMERIPYSKHAGQGAIGRPVLLIHSAYISSAVYALNNSSISFVLSDAGFDVWLFNARGSGLSRTLNIYKNSRSLPNMSSISWNFSHQEIGVYDMTAAIDFILKKTERHKLDVIGYSLGAAIALAGLSDRPEYNSKINKLVLLAPLSKTSPTRDFLKMIRSFSKLLILTLKRFDFWPPITDPDTTFQSIRSWCTNENGFTFCEKFLNMAEGTSLPMNKNTVIDMMSIYPQPMSVKTSKHLLQLVTSGRFCHFDYGPSENMLRYNRTTPPDYDLSKVTAPTYILHSKYDVIVVPEDVRWMVSQLPNVKNVHYIDMIPFGHLSFCLSPVMKDVVFSRVVNILLDASK